jgi:exodeoxyribonuclease V beta subunit
MVIMNAFDLAHTPLIGSKLIEAGAGTGKTYTIAGLFVRLILELQLTVEQILVVTYTKAATEELRGRIRGKLVQTRNGFLEGKSDDAFVGELIRHNNDHKEALRRLKEAIADMDRASVFTIHGFCQRILHENAFETGSLYDTELIPEPSAIYLEIAADFWRSHMYRAAPELINYLLINKNVEGPESFYTLYKQVTAPELKIIPEPERPELNSLEGFRRLYNALADRWPREREQVRDRLMSTSLKANIYGNFRPVPSIPGSDVRQLRTAALISAMNRFVSSGANSFPLFKGFEKLTATKISASTKKDNPVPDHSFFDLCDQLFTNAETLAAEMDAYFLYLKSEFFKFTRLQLHQHKKESNILFYDDLLLKVKRALDDEDDTGDGMLAAAVRQKYKAALVDEFQDTDPIQYAIFSQIFQGPASLLFMIGDPKQSIYSFRGADIFSYMDAAADTRDRYTLLENWRSQPGLIQAVNTLFSTVEKPFLFDEISFTKATAGHRSIDKNESDGPPLQIWYLPAESGQKTNKSEAVQIISDTVADEISTLISNRDNPVAAGDIAVLVRTNRQARIIKESLVTRSVPSVLYGAGSVFETKEALEMLRILTGIVETGNEHRFRGALATDMIGVSGDEIGTIDTRPEAWDGYRERFRSYHDQWQRLGFLRMFTSILSREGVRSRLLAFADGDRRLTNVLHLGELLHSESLNESAGMTQLIDWLQIQCNPEVVRNEEHPLRLESDASAVKIVTIHKSKGLEYPVVFCPFCWESSLIKRNRPVVCHAEGTGQSMVLDLGSDAIEENTRRAQNELLAENLRLLYVAVTRARERCYLVWGNIKTAETSALAYLLHGSGRTEDEDVAGSTARHTAGMAADELAADLDRLVKRSDQTIAVDVLPLAHGLTIAPQTADDESLFCRKFSGTITRDWRLSSYSSLISRQQKDTDQPDYDTHLHSSQPQTEMVVNRTLSERPDQERNIFSFPKGARSGIFFHALLEMLEFDNQSPGYPDDLVRVKLREYGLDSAWQNIVLKMLQNVRATRLSTGDHSFTLSSISSSCRINEMEFHFPVAAFTAGGLAAVFKAHKGSGIPVDFERQIERLEINPGSGFIKGYIDMVFQEAGRYYILDWKSNYLGGQPADYSRSTLEKIMAEEFYALQYCLYSLAFDRYARITIPDYRWERDFGGVFYIFIRGVTADKSSKTGVFYARPGLDLIRSLEKTLIG